MGEGGVPPIVENPEGGQWEGGEMEDGKQEGGKNGHTVRGILQSNFA